MGSASQVLNFGAGPAKLPQEVRISFILELGMRIKELKRRTLLYYFSSLDFKMHARFALQYFFNFKY